MTDFHTFAESFTGTGLAMCEILDALTNGNWHAIVAAMDQPTKPLTQRQIKRAILSEARKAAEANGLDNRSRKQIAKAMLAQFGIGVTKH